ncbi:tryptophan--tRNA ligase [Campylobacter troglodytis]|uniref:tryptophan--tRNA ligase n=1 Tax=Campylobacter troglodytis TaxID=654363 RepID=UPI00115C4477|nr:tryptophan--tRNA ligase [Campylobacter troglodytis]TQR53929.1 tryptophan--tRNA ligase [Campylobacter troglodytis]
MRVLTGLQPSGDLHIGNYFGAIKAMVDAQNTQDMFIFIANYHAMTSNPPNLRQNSLKAAAAFLSLGVKPDICTFWLQSDVKEVLELYWILSQITPMGLLERAHSYKDKLAKGLNATHGLFSYPVLMAADILLYSSELVPVGKDQVQHLEIARDLAVKFNEKFGDTFILPQAQINEEVAVVPGIDGEKMSKSYKNTIDIFASAKDLKKQISAIITDSSPLQAPKEWHSCNVYKISRLFLDESGQNNLQARYERGGEGHGHFKAYLNELILDYFSTARSEYERLLAKPGEIKEILEFGATKARKIAREKMQELYAKIGL